MAGPRRLVIGLSVLIGSTAEHEARSSGAPGPSLARNVGVPSQGGHVIFAEGFEQPGKRRWQIWSDSQEIHQRHTSRTVHSGKLALEGEVRGEGWINHHLIEDGSLNLVLKRNAVLSFWYFAEAENAFLALSAAIHALGKRHEIGLGPIGFPGRWNRVELNLVRDFYPELDGAKLGSQSGTAIEIPARAGPGGGRFVIDDLMIENKPAWGLEEKYGSYVRRTGIKKLSDRVPHWICYPWPGLGEVFRPTGKWYFRRRFQIQGGVREATLILAGDNGCRAFLNGTLVGEANFKKAARFSVRPLLKRGDNLVAIENENGRPSTEALYCAVHDKAAVLAQLEVLTQTRKTVVLRSDGSWLTTDRAEGEDWRLPAFNDSSWEQATPLADAWDLPWYAEGNFSEVFPCQADRTAFERLRKEKAPTCSVRILNGGPELLLDGRPVFPFLYFNHDMLKMMDLMQDHAMIGCHLHIAKGRPWGVKTFERVVLSLLRQDPEGRFVVMLELPAYWQEDENYREELQEVADKSTGGSTGEYASHASQRWRSRTLKALREFVAGVESSPIASRIIGYIPVHAMEWHYYDYWLMPDVSPCMAKRFAQWVRARYKEESVWKAKWGNRFDGFDSIHCPAKEERVASSFGLFRDPRDGSDRYVIDYYRFHNELVAENILAVAKAIKEASRRRVVVGTFYGYLRAQCTQDLGGLAVEKLLHSPDIDFLLSFVSYRSYPIDGAKNWYGWARGVGGDGGYQLTPVGSMKAHGKLPMVELDLATFRHPAPVVAAGVCGGAGADSLEGTLRILRRDMAHMLCDGIAYERMDPCLAGCDADATILRERRKWLKLGKESTRRGVGRASISEVAWLVDYESLYYNAHWQKAPAMKGWQHSVFDYWFWIVQQAALYRLSAPFDTFIWKDLLRAEQKRYKLYLVSNVFLLSDWQLQALKRALCCDGAVVVWIYAPGFVSPEGLSAQRVSELTGIEVEMTATPGPMMVDVTDSLSPITRSAETAFGVNEEHFPRFIVRDREAEVLGVWRGTREPAFAMKKLKDWTSVYVGFAPVPPKMLRNIARCAGVHTYSDRMDVVYGNASYLAVVANGEGERTLTFSHPMRDAWTANPVPRKLTLQLGNGEVRLFRK